MKSFAAFGLSVPVNDDDDSSPASQLYPQIVADGERLFVVWQDTRHGNDNIYAATSVDGGATWSGDLRVSDNSPGATVEMLPELPQELLDEHRVVEPLEAIVPRRERDSPEVFCELGPHTVRVRREVELERPRWARPVRLALHRLRARTRWP